MSKSKSNKVRKELKKVKHIIKFLSHSPANKITKAILGDSPDGVIRAIANAALNLQQNPDVKLDPAPRNLLSTYLRSFGILTDRKISIENSIIQLLLIIQLFNLFQLRFQAQAPNARGRLPPVSQSTSWFSIIVYRQRIYFSYIQSRIKQ